MLTPAATLRPLRGGATCHSCACAPATALSPLIEEGNVWTLELPRGFLSFALEKDLRFDPAFLRHVPLIERVLDRFQARPDSHHRPQRNGLAGRGSGARSQFAARGKLAHQRARISRAPVRLVSAPAARASIGGDGAEDRRLALATAAILTREPACCLRPIPSFARSSSS